MNRIKKKPIPHERYILMEEKITQNVFYNVLEGIEKFTKNSKAIGA